jgi:hypothetical protein
MLHLTDDDPQDRSLLVRVVREETGEFLPARVSNVAWLEGAAKAVAEGDEIARRAKEHAVQSGGVYIAWVPNDLVSRVGALRP